MKYNKPVISYNKTKVNYFCMISHTGNIEFKDQPFCSDKWPGENITSKYD